MEALEIRRIVDGRGKSVYAIEKELKIPNGVIGKALSGKKGLPELYWERLRGLSVDEAKKEFIEERVVNQELKEEDIEDDIVMDFGEVPQQRDVKRPDGSLFDLL